MLYLFSSNNQVQYVQDVLDLLASPNGTHHTFRYMSRHLNDAAEQHWEQLAGKSALIHFSLQQKAKYQPAVFFPVRRATVVSGERVGDVRIIKFRADDVIAFNEPSQPGDYADVTTKYQAELRRRNVPVPYDKSASLVDTDVLQPAIPLIDLGADAVQPPNRGSAKLVRFQRIVEYLSRTETFSTAQFFYVDGILEQKNGDMTAVDMTESGRYELIAGKSYEVEILHAQPRGVPVLPATIKVSADGKVLQTIGTGDFPIRSEYDRATVPVTATSATDQEPRGTQLAIGIDNAGDRLVPLVRLPVSVIAPKGKSYVVAAGTTASLMALAVPTLVKDGASIWRYAIALTASSVTSWLWMFGFSRKGP